MSIIPGRDTPFDAVVPLLVVGGGACGLVAALAARDAGVDVVVLERDPMPQGSTSMSLGALCASGSAEQRRHGVDDGADRFFADVMAKTGGAADPVLARLVGARSGPTLDWLSDRHGVPLLLETGWKPAFGHSVMRMHVTPGRTGQDLMQRLLLACEAAGVDILTDAHVTDLHAEGDRVTGVRLRRPDGSVEDIGCQALVLATCGFGGNAEMVRRHIPAMADAPYFGWEGNRGEGIAWGQALGAALADMDAYQGLGLLASPAAIDVNPRFLIEGGIQVNRHGARFAHELEDVSGAGARVIAQPDGLAWVIYDQRIHDSCASLPQYVALREAGGARQAATAEALAAQAGIDPAGLAATLGQVAAHVESGEADPFGRRFTGPALSAPYYAIRVTGALFHTQGGLVVDSDARVQRATGGPLPNLFAGGGAARSIGGPGPSGYLPGAGLCMAVTLGRVAGEAAARLVTAS
ncbi:FAD-dependent oxidoreductase [Nitrospirillum pindoramense]|uniref:Fumarate reductase flavoprotein subunit n=1 Tax=Nitrospirillum amazonense TaxID=28077 RepID=A0A560HHE9_9PROT|nr:FAD-dependent oxidoreductase [Nitrospirillum amazonense]TWB45883.1 fumarate reductase flavoprotein subunit [Nitrospirillum amazonense]